MNAERLSWEEAVRSLLAREDQAELVRACYYDGTPIAAAERFHASEEWQATRALLPAPGGDALDVGAGRGISSYALARDGWKVTALEPDPSDLVGSGAIRAVAASSRLSITVVEDFGETLPFDSGSFDVVYGRAVLHHARDLRAFCSELFRVLRPGGTIVAAREHVVSSAAQLQRFLAEHPLHRSYGGENAYSRGSYADALTRGGFADLHVLAPFASPVNFAPWTRPRFDLGSQGSSAASWAAARRPGSSARTPSSRRCAGRLEW
jgi:2-polyprenyl-3-methyl-5-hydroxy-6-metoxy-1,4-benzoquinol methylase